MNQTEFEEELKQLCGKDVNIFLKEDKVDISARGLLSYCGGNIWQTKYGEEIVIRFTPSRVQAVVGRKIFLLSLEESPAHRHAYISLEHLLKDYHLTKEDVLWEILREKLNIKIEEPCNEDEICRVLLNGRGVEIVHTEE